MNKLALWIIGGLFFAGVVLALKYQIEVNATQRVRIEQQAAALKAAEELRSAAEDALLARDRDVAKITATNRRLQHDITKALQGDACAIVPVPPALDQLLCERAPGACEEAVPAGSPAARAPVAALGRVRTWGYLAEWATEVAAVVDALNADNRAEQQFCK